MNICNLCICLCGSFQSFYSRQLHLKLKGLQLLEAIWGTWGFGTCFHSSYCVEVWQELWKGFGDLKYVCKTFPHSCGSEHMRYGVKEYKRGYFDWGILVPLIQQWGQNIVRCCLNFGFSLRSTAKRKMLWSRSEQCSIFSISTAVFKAFTW